MLNNNIYLLFHCDQWKSKDSMRLVTATTKPEKLKKVLTEEVRRKNMEVHNNHSLYLPVEQINGQLDYGYIEIVRDGERQ